MLTAIPEDFGSGGSGLAPGGAAGLPCLRDLLEEHRAALDELQGESSDSINARFATTANVNLATTALTAIDGVTPLPGDIVLVRRQTTAAQNGLYLASAGAWARLLDANGDSVLEEGMIVSAAEGTANGAQLFILGSDLTTWRGGAPVAAPAGTNLTNTATQTIQRSEGDWRKLPALSQGGTLTLGTTGALNGDQIEITRTDLSAFTYAIVNGGAGAGTLATFPVSKLASAKFQFDGTNWALRSIGQLA